MGGELFFLRPVRTLMRTTRRVSAGDLGARSRLGPVAGELGQLSQAFDEMAETLQGAERQRAQQEELRRQYSILEAELAQAARVQAELLPRDRPSLPGFDLAARCIPAREVGGDFYDWQESPPGDFSLTLADVTGKGMAAALLMATVRAALRAGAHDGPPALAIQAAATALESDLESSRSFVTLFHARLEVTTRRLSYVDAGHGHAFLRRADGGVDELLPRGLPLGVLPGEQYQEGSLTLCPGDALVLYSDGLVDACPDLSPDRAAVAGRLAGASGAAEMVDRLVALARAGGPLPDDLTVVVLRCVARPEGGSDGRQH
jgi:serine phosphatase RsbU (regulator of sigma subunit)